MKPLPRIRSLIEARQIKNALASFGYQRTGSIQGYYGSAQYQHIGTGAKIYKMGDTYHFSGSKTKFKSVDDMIPSLRAKHGEPFKDYESRHSILTKVNVKPNIEPDTANKIVMQHIHNPTPANFESMSRVLGNHLLSSDTIGHLYQHLVKNPRKYSEQIHQLSRNEKTPGHVLNDIYNNHKGIRSSSNGYTITDNLVHNHSTPGSILTHIYNNSPEHHNSLLYNRSTPFEIKSKIDATRALRQVQKDWE